MNNLICIGVLVLGLCIGFYAGQQHGAWKTQKQAVARGYGHFVLDEQSGWKSFEWNEVKP